MINQCYPPNYPTKSCCRKRYLNKTRMHALAFSNIYRKLSWSTKRESHIS